MKNFPLLPVVCVIAVLYFASCSKPNPSVQPDPGPEPQPTPTPEVVYTPLTKGAGRQYGDYYGKNTEDYYFQLYNGQVDEYGYFVGECQSVTFDCFSVLSTIMDKTTPLASGEYTAADSYAEHTFLIGNDVTWREFLQGEADWLTDFFGETYTVEDLMPEYGVTADMLDKLTWDGNAGSSYFRRDAEGNEMERAITNGTIVATVSGNNYEFKIDFEIDGQQYHFSYEGDIELEDTREKPGPEPGEMIDFEGEYAVAYSWGESWEGAAEQHTVWQLMVYNDTTDEVAEIDLVDVPNATTISTATYEIVAPVAANIKPGVAVGYYSEYGWAFGSWYGTHSNNTVLYEGNEGKMTVFVSGGNAYLNGWITETATGQQVRITMTNKPITIDLDASSAKSSSKKISFTHKYHSNEKKHSIRQHGAGSISTADCM